MIIKDALSFTAVAPLKPQLHISFPAQLFPKSMNNLVKKKKLSIDHNNSDLNFTFDNWVVENDLAPTDICYLGTLYRNKGTIN